MMSINAMSPSFTGAYTKMDSEWYEMTQDKKVSSDALKQDFEMSDKKQVMLVSCDTVRADFGGFKMDISVDETPLILTGKEAEEFEDPKSNKESLLNRFCKGFFEFRTPVKIENQDTLDFDA